MFKTLNRYLYIINIYIYIYQSLIYHQIKKKKQVNGYNSLTIYCEN